MVLFRCGGARWVPSALATANQSWRAARDCQRPESQRRQALENNTGAGERLLATAELDPGTQSAFREPSTSRAMPCCGRATVAMASRRRSRRPAAITPISRLKPCSLYCLQGQLKTFFRNPPIPAHAAENRRSIRLPSMCSPGPSAASLPVDSFRPGPSIPTVCLSFRAWRRSTWTPRTRRTTVAVRESHETPKCVTPKRLPATRPA